MKHTTTTTKKNDEFNKINLKIIELWNICFETHILIHLYYYYNKIERERERKKRNNKKRLSEIKNEI